VNNAKVTNATHTGEVTGSGALTVDPTAISNKTALGSLAGTEEFLINDGGVLKKVLASNVGGGDSIYTADGTISSSRIVNVNSLLLTFDNSSMLNKGTNTLVGTTNFELQNSASTSLLKVQNDGSTTIGGDTQIDGTLTIDNQGATPAVGIDLWYNPVLGGTSHDIKFSTVNGGFEVGRIKSLWNGNSDVSLILGDFTDLETLHIRGGKVGIRESNPTAQLHVKGTGTTSGTTALLVQNATPAELFKITDDGSLYTVGFQGFTGTGAYTNFTIKNGIITAAS